MAIAHTRMKPLSRSNGSTVRMLAYRAGTELTCNITGEVFDYTHKLVQGVELLLPKDAPAWAVDLQKLIAENRQTGVQGFSDLAESFEKRKDSQPYREYEFALPRELTAEQCTDLARDFIQDQMCGLGITVLANFHLDEDPETGDAKYHCHAVMLTRYLQENRPPLSRPLSGDC